MDKKSAIIESLSGRIPELDGVRGFAMFLVLVSHFVEFATYDGTNPIVQILLSFCRLGWTGLDLFFVLSGFLICGILIDNRDAKNYFRVFYIRRTLRVFPLYYFLLIILSIFVIINLYDLINLPESIFAFPYPAWSYFTYTHNIYMAYHNSFGTATLGPTWSLAVEEQFYLTFPFIIRYVPRKYLVGLLFFIAFGALFFRLALAIYYPTRPFAILMLAPARADSLLIGALLAFAIRSNVVSEFVIRHRPKFYPLLPVLFLLFLGALLTNIFWNIVWLPAVFCFMFLGLFYATLIILTLTAKDGDFLKKFFRNRIFMELGSLSYFIYLTHIGFLSIVHWLFGGSGKTPLGFLWLVEITLTLLACILLAKISRKYFEKPLIQFGHRFKYVKSRDYEK